MKKFTKQEILELYGQVTLGEISFSQMVEIMNKRVSEAVSEADKPCIEDIPKSKFKVGDKVRIKNGISSKTHYNIRPAFVEEMDKLIGKELTVENCIKSGFVACDGYYFSEEWLEPYVEGLKKGDLAIFWDDSKKCAIIRIYDRPNESDEYFRHKDTQGVNWKNAIKFESKEQYERLIKGEI